jgi:raffinose/stachyose/melibiose transport system substrate-binding protein
MKRSSQGKRSPQKGWSLLVAGVALATLAAACGSSATTTAGSGSTTASINVWWVTNGTNVDDLWQTIATDFNNSHPGDKVNIEIQPSSNSYKGKLLAALGTSSPPALFFSWGGGPMQQYIQDGVIQPFADPGQSNAGNPSWKDKFLPASLDAVTFNSKIYGMPILGTQPVFFFYNKSVFSSAGLSFPTSFSDLLNDCSTFNSKGIIPIALGNADEWEGLMYLEYLTDRIGGPQAFLNVQDNKANAWSAPALQQALADIQTLAQDKCFNTGYDSITYTNGSTDAMVYQGKAAMQLMGDWDLGGIQSDDASIITNNGIGIGNFPTVSGGSGNAADLEGNTTSYTGMAAHLSKAQTYVAEQFMQYFYSQTYAVAEIGDGQVPVIAGTSNLLGSSSLSQYLKPVYQDVVSAPYFQYSWDQALGPTKATPMLDNLAKIFELTETPQAFAQAMNSYQT